LDTTASSSPGRNASQAVLKSFQLSSKEHPVSFFAEFWDFMRQRKKFWLLPLLTLMLMFSGLIVLTKGSAIAPFIYAIF
jgi:hypothetical protein